MKCIGFPDNVDCPNEAGTRWSKHWCEACDEKRRSHITAQLERMIYCAETGEPFYPREEVVRETEAEE